MHKFKVILRRIRFWSNITIAYINRYKIWIISILIVLFLGLIIFQKIWSKISQTNLIDIGFVGIYSLENIPTDVLALVTQSLITTDTSQKPIPNLASHWTVSEDGKTYIVFLKDNLLWHDSTAVKAEDISIAISNVQINAPNNKTIEFKLPNPIYSFPLVLDKPIFKTKSFYGTGDFRIVDINQVDQIIKKITLIPKNSKLPRVNIKFYQTEEQLLEALKIGEVNFAKVAHAQSLNNWPNLNVKKDIDYSEIITIFFNNEDSSLSSKELRQALTFAINRSDFDGLPAYGPISPVNWTFNENLKRYDYNSAKAKELLAKINNNKIKITLNVSPGLDEIANQIKRDWEAIGVETTLNLEIKPTSEFQALLAVNKLTPDPDQYAFWHSTQGKTNITHYKNVKVDKLLEDARITKDDQERKTLYLDFQKFLVEDAPSTFLYYPYKYEVIYKNIEQLYAKLPKISLF